ncbi:MAG: tRNA 2-thiouridine(34) synthase MnmA [Gammaproteobacteria bacterium]|nr:tRNA 2-thiouridine(34) synthase MnmA [Gammaproteobacteria bacterium]
MIVVGLSGGVDSAVAALLLREQNLEIEGLFMANWEEGDAYCTISADYQDALAVCRELRIPLHRVDFAVEYRQRVFDYFLTEYRAGRTPNPDVPCNRDIKFGVCLEYVRRLGGNRFATGHYARRINGPRGVELHKALDSNKDQSYFLHSLKRVQLEAALFPLGELTKIEVRERARAAGLLVHDKPDSTGICFIGERPFYEFLNQYIAHAPGPIETPEGEQIGSHHGLAFYTLGQRGGLEIGGRSGHAEAAWYVARKDQHKNALIVVQGHDHPLLLSKSVSTAKAHWLIDAPSSPFEASVKLRYRQTDQPCRVVPLDDGRLLIDCESPQRAVTPGQFAVLFLNSQCLGGAVIESTAP